MLGKKCAPTVLCHDVWKGPELVLKNKKQKKKLTLSLSDLELDYKDNDGQVQFPLDLPNLGSRKTLLKNPFLLYQIKQAIVLYIW